MSAPPDLTPSNGKRFFQLFPGVSAAIFMGLADSALVSLAMPDLARAFGGSDGLWLVLLCFMTASMVSMPIAGRLSDAIGRRECLLLAIAIFLCGAIGAALSQGLVTLCAFRIIQGLGGGGLVSVSHALIGETVPGRTRAKYQGYLSAIPLAANGMGPVIGGVLIASFGWRAVFLMHVPVALIAALALWRFKPVARARSPFRLDLLGLALLAASMASLLVWLNQLQNAGQVPSFPLLFLCLTLIALLAWQQSRSARPLLSGEVWRNRGLRFAHASAALHGALYFSLIAQLPILLGVGHGLGVRQIGVEILVLSLGMVLGSTLTGQCVSRTGRTVIWGAVGMTLMAVCLVAAALWGRPEGVWLSVSLFLLGIFCGTVMGPVQVVVQLAAGPQLLGTVSGSLQLARMVGVALGVALVVTVQNRALAMTGAGAEFTARLRGGEALGPMSAGLEWALSATLLALALYAALLALSLARQPLQRA